MTASLHPERHRRIDVVCSGGAWCGIDEHGVTVIMKDRKDDAVETVANAGTSDLPVTVRIHRADGSIESERVFPEVDRRSPDPL